MIRQQKTKNKSVSRCADCGDDLSEEENLFPNRNPEGKPICDSCRHDYEFTCCCCHDWHSDKEQGAIGNLLVVMDAEDADIPIGLYEIKAHPYFVDAMLWVDLYADALTRLGTVPSTIDTIGHAAGHVCSECSARLKKECSGDAKRF